MQTPPAQSAIVMMDLATAPPSPQRGYQTSRTTDYQSALKHTSSQSHIISGNPEHSTAEVPKPDMEAAHVATARFIAPHNNPAVATQQSALTAAVSDRTAAQTDLKFLREVQNPAVTGAAVDTVPQGDVTFGGSAGPSFVRQVQPVYPLAAKKFNREGKVLLRLTIDESGILKNVEVMEDPGHGFAESAIEAMKRSRFSPAYRNGHPVMVKTLLPIRFRLRSSEQSTVRLERK